MKNSKIALNILLFITNFILFGAMFLICVMCNKEIIYTEVKPDPIYKKVDKVVEKDVYDQQSPIIPTEKERGREIILLDKSGSMEEFITDLYKDNVEFFRKNDVWTFDTEVHKDVSLENVEFSGDTNVFQAINAAADSGYNTIWLCSDLEHNTGDIKLSELAKKLHIIVYSPKILDVEKTGTVIEELKLGEVKVITIN